MAAKGQSKHTAESYRQTLKPNARLSRLLRLARMVKRERDGKVPAP